MKNNIFKILIFIFISNPALFAENLNITSKSIFVDKKTEVTVFEKEVLIA